MKKIAYKFAYNEPRFGEISIDPTDPVEDGNEWTEAEVIRVIEEHYPEAIDIEIIEAEEVNG